MKLKIKNISDKDIKRKFKYWNTCFIVGLFFLGLILLAILFSDKYIILILSICSLPILFTVLFSKQELNYLKLMMEIRMKYKGDK